MGIQYCGSFVLGRQFINVQNEGKFCVLMPNPNEKSQTFLENFKFPAQKIYDGLSICGRSIRIQSDFEVLVT